MRVKATKKNIQKAKVAPDLISKALEMGKAAFHRGVYGCAYDEEFLELLWAEFGTVIGVNHLERIKMMDAWYYAQTTERLRMPFEY